MKHEVIDYKWGLERRQDKQQQEEQQQEQKRAEEPQQTQSEPTGCTAWPIRENKQQDIRGFIRSEKAKHTPGICVENKKNSTRENTP